MQIKNLKTLLLIPNVYYLFIFTYFIFVFYILFLIFYFINNKYHPKISSPQSKAATVAALKKVPNGI